MDIVQDTTSTLINKSTKLTLLINFILIILMIANSFIHFNESNRNLNKYLEEEKINNVRFLNSNTTISYHELTKRYLAEENNSLSTENQFLNDVNSQKKKKFIEKLINHSFTGKWKSKNKFGGFTHTEGKMRLFFQNYLMRGPKGSYYNFIIFFYDGENKERWMFMQNAFPFSFSDNSTYISTYNQTRFGHKNVQVFTSELQIFDPLVKKYEWININLVSNDSLIMVSEQYSEINGKIESILLPEIDISFEVSLDKDGIFHHVSNFSLVLSLLAGIQMLNSKFYLDKFAENEMEAIKYSYIGMLINIIWNGFICFTCFVTSLYDDRLFNDFIVPTAIYFLNFSYFELKIILYIWRANIFRGQSSDLQYSGETQFKNKLLRLYVFLYVTMLLIYVYGPQIFFWKSFLYSIISITWLPQIYLNLKRGRRNYIPLFTTLIVSLNKLFVPLYFRLCPNNFLDLPTDYFFSIAICIIIAAQVFILLMQRIFGLRCLLPKFMLPVKVDFRKTKKDLNKLKLDLDNMACSICLGNFTNLNSSNITKTDTDLQVLPNRTSLEIENKVVKRVSCCNKLLIRKRNCNDYCSKLISWCNSDSTQSGDFMYTPCHHLFHAECLRAWMEIKNSCPECRRVFPVDNNPSIVSNHINSNPNV